MVRALGPEPRPNLCRTAVSGGTTHSSTDLLLARRPAETETRSLEVTRLHSATGESRRADRRPRRSLPEVSCPAAPARRTVFAGLPRPGTFRNTTASRPGP